MDISKHIAALLFEHDCVIVPDFGGFVSNEKEGFSDPLTGRFFPPSKSLTFNRNLISNDGLLATRVGVFTDKSYSDALSLIREQVIEWKSQLDRDGRLVLSQVGKLYADTHGNWRFVQDENRNFMAESFGLSSIKLKPRVKEIKLEPIITETVQETETPVIELHTEKSGSRKLRKYLVAAACFIPVAFYSYWIPSQTHAVDRGFIKVSDFNPFRSEITERAYRFNNYNLAAETYQSESFSEEHLTLENESGSVAYVIATTPVKPEETIRGNYHVIGGCFRNENYAQNRIGELRSKGYDSYLLDVKNGLHRVCVQSYTSNNAAHEAVSELERSGDSGWVLKK